MSRSGDHGRRSWHAGETGSMETGPEPKPGRLRSVEEPSMSRSPFRTLAAFVGGMALSLVVVFAADAAYGHRPAPATPSVSTPKPSPVVAPTSPPPEPISAPSDRANGDIAVPLSNLTGDDVSVVIDDATGKLDVASSGNPGDGMSVRWFDVEVEHIYADTLHVVWVGLPRDEIVGLGITQQGGSIHLAFTQDAPPADSDALGFDRVLELSFDAPIRSEDVVTSVQERPAA